MRSLSQIVEQALLLNYMLLELDKNQCTYMMRFLFTESSSDDWEKDFDIEDIPQNIN